jgi:hypothetical protein
VCVCVSLCPSHHRMLLLWYGSLLITKHIFILEWWKKKSLSTCCMLEWWCRELEAVLFTHSVSAEQGWLCLVPAALRPQPTVLVFLLSTGYAALCSLSLCTCPEAPHRSNSSIPFY